MRIAIYAIARNEIWEVPGWAAAAREADYRLVLDTGSTDGTAAALAKSGVIVHRATVRPWRFDDARNAALALLPADIDVCIALDMDERLRGKDCPSGTGWREPIIANWRSGTTMLRCGMNSNGTYYYTGRIHARAGYRWKCPVHECLYWRGAGLSHDQYTDSLAIDHLPLPQKPRQAERGMLEEAVAEWPHDARMALQLGWHLVLNGEKHRGIEELRRYLDQNQTGPDAAFVHRLIAVNDDPANLLMHLERAEDAHPAASNSCLLADHYRGQGLWNECHTACQAGLARERMRGPVGHWGDDPRLTTSWLNDTAAHAYLMMLRPQWTTS